MSTRIYGKQLRLEVDGTDYWADVTSCVKKSEPDSDRSVTFEDANTGDAFKHYFEITAIQSTDSTSWWSFCESNVGQSFPFEYAVHGNATITTNQPHLIGTLTIPQPPEIGGEANRKKEYLFTMRVDIDGTPTLDRTP